METPTDAATDGWMASDLAARTAAETDAYWDADSAPTLDGLPMDAPMAGEWAVSRDVWRDATRARWTASTTDAS